MREPGVIATPRSQFKHHRFQKSLDIVQLVAPIAEYIIPKDCDGHCKPKTIARLGRRHKYPPISAMSGWSHYQEEITVAGTDWATEVFHLAETLSFKIPPDPWDQGKPGQYRACHADTQLITCFVNRHVFLPDELDAPSDLNNMANHLRAIMPPVMLKSGLIVVSKVVCDVCKDFVKHVNETLGLNIIVEERTQIYAGSTCQVVNQLTIQRLNDADLFECPCHCIATS